MGARTEGTDVPSGLGDADVDAFVDANIISFAAWDLVAYLSQRPDDVRTLPEYVHLLSRAEGDVQPAVERLVKTGVLLESRSGDEVVYRLTRDDAVLQVVARFVSLSTRRDHRLEFVRRVLGQVTPS